MKLTAARVLGWPVFSVTLLSAMFTFMACAPMPTSTPPSAPAISWGAFNANLAAMPTNSSIPLVFFSKNEWQEQSGQMPHFASARYPDLLVGEPFSFQIALKVTNNELTVLDSHGVDIVDRSAPRVNTSRSDGSFPYPGGVDWIARKSPPPDKSVANIEVVYACKQDPDYADFPCQVQRELTIVVTIAPPVNGMAHGAGFDFTLVYRNSAGEARTTIHAVYIEPGKCKVSSLNSGADEMLAFETRAVAWFLNDCFAYTVGFASNGVSLGELANRTVIPPERGSEHDFNGTVSFVVPKVRSLDVTLAADDGLGRHDNYLLRLTQHHTIDPCSISKADPACPAACQGPNPPSSCPRPVPDECPNTPDKHKITWKFTYACGGGGALFTFPDSEPACTSEEALQSVRIRHPDCSVPQFVGMVAPDPTDPTGTVSPMCAANQTQVTKTFCLSCSTMQGQQSVPETGTGCSLGDAERNALGMRPPNQMCYTLNEGMCPEKKP